jgi:hypothetical protein
MAAADGAAEPIPIHPADLPSAAVAMMAVTVMVAMARSIVVVAPALLRPVDRRSVGQRHPALVVRSLGCRHGRGRFRALRRPANGGTPGESEQPEDE